MSILELIEGNRWDDLLRIFEQSKKSCQVRTENQQNDSSSVSLTSNISDSVRQQLLTPNNAGNYPMFIALLRGGTPSVFEKAIEIAPEILRLRNHTDKRATMFYTACQRLEYFHGSKGFQVFQNVVHTAPETLYYIHNLDGNKQTTVGVMGQRVHLFSPRSVSYAIRFIHCQWRTFYEVYESGILPGNICEQIVDLTPPFLADNMDWSCLNPLDTFLLEDIASFMNRIRKTTMS